MSQHQIAHTKFYCQEIDEETSDVGKVQQGLASILNSTTSSTLISAPRTNNINRLPPDLFVLALRRKLRIPIHRKQLKCRCKKYIDIYGDHYFECKYFRKGWLHDQIRNTYYVKWRILKDLTGLIRDPSQVLWEPTKVTNKYKNARPLNVALITTQGLRGIDVRTAKLAPIAPSPDKQEETTTTAHLRSIKVLKWRGTSCSNKKSVSTERWKTHDKDDIKGHIIMTELSQENVLMIPAVVDPLMRDGPAIHWLYEAPPKKAFKRGDYKFGVTERTNSLGMVS